MIHSKKGVLIMAYSRENAFKLIGEVTKKIRNTEYNSVTFKGVKNCSRSDLEDTILYAQTIIDYGDYSKLMSPRGNVFDILQAYNLV